MTLNSQLLELFYIITFKTGFVLITMKRIASVFLSCRCIMSHLLLSSCKMVDYRNPKRDQKVPEKSALYTQPLDIITDQLCLHIILPRLSTRWRCSSVDAALCTSLTKHTAFLHNDR